MVRVYDVLEFIVQNWSGDHADKLPKTINSILEKELCAFRFLGKQIAPITDETELTAIDEAAMHASDAVRRHLNRAIELLSDRHDPDYRPGDAANRWPA